jgi:hypothetical protein
LYQGSCILHEWQLHVLANFTTRKEAHSINGIKELDPRTILHRVTKRKMIFLKLESQQYKAVKWFMKKEVSAKHF